MSVNVRNRDLESVVDEVRAIINENISLPPGYYISYGGQFENLQSARKRLAVAVPVALILIFIMLNFAFKSMREAILIYSAIPLAAVGGVLFLWIRGLPFSISAGVGFIALFGIAVLNGIVLIGHYKELKQQPHQNFKELIIQGTLSRLRPVLLTASAAALGFLPMAISTSAGAEVQRPLATVVIGGLITATLLTLVVLPVLYLLINKKSSGTAISPKVILLLGALLVIPFEGSAQEQTLTLNQAIELARQHNAKLSAQQLAVERQQAMKGAAYDFQPTNVYYNYDENNIAPNGSALKVWGIQQNFQLPNVYISKKRLNDEQVALEQYHFEVSNWNLEAQVSKAYYEIIYQMNLISNYQILDSAYSRFSLASQRRFEMGESNVLEKLTAESKHNDIKLQMEQAEKDLSIALTGLNRWMQAEAPFNIAYQALEPLLLKDSVESPGVRLFRQRSLVAEQQMKVQKQNWWPDLQLEYFQGNNSAENAQLYSGFQVGLGIPIIFGSQKSAVQVSAIEQQQSGLELLNYQHHLTNKRRQLLLELEKFERAIEYYNETGRALSTALIRTSDRSFKSGEIDFFQYIQTLDRGVQIQINYLQSLHGYNQTVLMLNYLIN